ncbi:ribonuclease H-like domain-containing protein, partial [Tanacetum coccineum]
MGYNVVPPPLTRLFAPPTIDLSNSGLEEFQQPEFQGYGPKASKSVCVDTSNEVKQTPETPLVEELVSEKAKQTIFPTKIEFVKQQDKIAKKPVKYTEMYRSQKPRGNQRNWNNLKSQQLVNTVKAKAVNTARPKAVNTARPHLAVVNAVRVNQENAGKPQQDDTRFIDSGCSRHMTRNIAYLLDFKEFDGGYVTFGGGTHGRKISGKGTLKTDSLVFKDVYFFNELNFNLFSVSQMCDKKNYVLFTDTECLVLSPNFKLPDESQILLKIPRKDNMYSFDMKNIVPKGSLTCLIAKATSDESMLWHMRLGHNYFKNINKLVNDNLFKNKVMDDFCREKGIRREYSVARTQQNGVAERRNMTLIEAARTML